MPRASAKTSDIDNCGLTLSELQELWLGVGHAGSLFRDEEDLRDAWDRGREVVMRIFGSSGRRPQAWWYFEAPALGLNWPGRDYEQSYLFEAGVLSKQEREQLLDDWRREFERAQAPGFDLSVSAGEILTGDRARRVHYRWADIPVALVEQWTMGRGARRRRDRKRPETVLRGGAAPMPEQSR